MNEFKIPVYIINLQKRMDRLLYIENEFSGRQEFTVTIVKAVEDQIPAVGLYKSLASIVLQAKNACLPYVIMKHLSL